MSTFLTGLEWREPIWFWLALFPWVLLLARQFLMDSLSKDYATPKLLPWARAQRAVSIRHNTFWRQLLLGVAWILFSASLAGPRIAQTVFDTDQENYGQLLVVVDVSRSMTADDIPPGRLQRVKLELLDLIDRTEQTRMGLIVYAARPHLLAPATADKSLLRFYVQQLRYGLLPTLGSDLTAALAFAGGQFDSGTFAKSILVIGDGEIAADNATNERSLDQTVARLRQQEITVYALGAGTRKGAAILAEDGSWLRYQNTDVVSRLQEARLKRIASLGGGSYSEIRNNDGEWQSLYDQGIARQHTRTAMARGAGWIIWKEFYAWFLIPAVLLWLAAYLRPLRREHGLSSLALFAIAVATLMPNSELEAAEAGWQEDAYHAYKNQSYQDARQRYARVPGYAGRMGEGSSYYRLEKFDQAIRQFVRATLDANDDRERAAALFNLANSYIKLSRYDDAIPIYRDALRYQPQDARIARNLGYALALRKKEQERNEALGRLGIGPKAITPPEGSDISDAGIRLDTERDTTRAPAPPLTTTTPGPDSDLVRQGIRRAELAATNIENTDDPTWTYDIKSPEGVALKADTIQNDESILWQRILEYEEEFPVLVETPYELPGVQPW